MAVLLIACTPLTIPLTQSFDAWLHDTVVNSRGQERRKALAAWGSAPGARDVSGMA